MAHWSRLRVPDALSSENLGSEPGELPLTEMKNMKNLFILFTFMPDFSMGPLLILQNPALILFFSLKRTHSSEKEEGKICSFFNYPHLLTLSLLPGSASLREWKQPEVGVGGGGLHNAFDWRCGPPPSLIRPGLHFYAWNIEVDWKHSVAIQTLKKRDPLSFIRYEDLQ